MQPKFCLAPPLVVRPALLFTSHCINKITNKKRVSFTYDKFNVHINNSTATTRAIKKPLPSSSICKNLLYPTPISNAELRMDSLPSSVPVSQMTAPLTKPNGCSGPEKSGPNFTLACCSHQEKLQEKDVRDRLNCLSRYNVLQDLKHGTYPTIGQLIMSSKFSCPAKTHSFTSDVHFDHIVLTLLKSGLLGPYLIVIIAKTSKLYVHLIKMMTYCVEIDFHPLARYNLNYKHQDIVPHERVMIFLAAVIYYEFNMASVMRFLGNNYTAAYRDVPEILDTI